MRIRTIMLICLLYAISAQAQIDFLAFKADYATFKGAAEKTYIEVYLSFYQDDLTYQDEDTLQAAHFSHNVSIFQNDSLMVEANRSYRNVLPPEGLSRNFNQFMDVFAFELESGKYKVQAGLNDLVSLKSGNFSLDLDVPSYADSFAISSVELATKVQKAAAVSAFSNKNNMEILPNPSRVFGVIQPLMYFYFEAYNMELDANNKNSYSYHYFITDENGKTVRDFAEKTRERGTSTIAEATGTNVIALPQATYTLNIDLKDLPSGTVRSAKKEFIVVKPQKKKSTSDLAVQYDDMLEYRNMTPEQLELEFMKVKYIAVPKEKEIFDGLEDKGMKRFMVEFWKRRDPDPQTPVNEYKAAYYEFIKLANETYSTNFKDGWKTDRGRVLLTYGKPDDIERNPNALNSQPYEVWFYYALEGGCEFIFGDLSGHGEYELLHSTYRNELQDPNWRARLGGSGGGFPTGF